MLLVRPTRIIFLLPVTFSQMLEYVGRKDFLLLFSWGEYFRVGSHLSIFFVIFFRSAVTHCHTNVILHSILLGIFS